MKNVFLVLFSVFVIQSVQATEIKIRFAGSSVDY